LRNIEIKKFKYIDIIRGYAIIMVLIVHYAIDFNTLYSSYVYKLSLLGQYGVMLFFMVSAYTLTQSLEYRNIRYENNILKKYFIRRFFRIAPLYYLILLFSYFFLKGIGVNQLTIIDTSQINMLIHFVFLDQLYVNFINNIIGVEWTISVEFLFYFILPLIVFKNQKFLIKVFLVSLMLSMVVMIFRKFYYIDGWWLHYTLLEWIYVFAGGVILYKYEIPNNILSKVHWVLYLVLLNFLIMSFIRLPFQHYYMFFNLVLLYMYIKHSNTENLFNDTIAYIGRISFSLYLIHYIVLRYAKEYFNLTWDTFGITLVITFIVATITFYIIEQPFIKFGKYITSRIK